MNRDEFFARLDKADEKEVRERLANGEYKTPQDSLAREWLRRRESARAEAAAERAEQRENAHLDIAKTSLKFTRTDRWISIIALCIAAISAIAARDDIEWLIRKVMAWFQ